MATRIRLRRVGRKGQAAFRIVVAGNMHARGGRVTETIGKYNPRTSPSYIEVDEGRALYWLREGAQPSESVQALFRKAGILKKLADGAEGEGTVRRGDPNGKTRVKPAPAVAQPKAEPAAKAAPEPAKPEAKAEAASGEVAAEAPAAEPAEEAEAAGEVQEEES